MLKFKTKGTSDLMDYTHYFVHYIKYHNTFFYKINRLTMIRINLLDCLLNINANDIPHISETSKEISNADITLQEIEDVVKGLANNKAPGLDDLSFQVNFTKCFGLMSLN